MENLLFLGVPILKHITVVYFCAKKVSCGSKKNFYFPDLNPIALRKGLQSLNLLDSERQKLYANLAFLSAIGLSFASPHHHFWCVLFSECVDTNGTECHFC